MPAAVVISLAFSTVYVIETTAKRQIQGKSLEQIVDIAVVDVNAHLSNGVTDVGFLAEDHTLQLWLEHGGDDARNRLEGQFEQFLGHKPQYDSVRLIERDGQEIVRVDVKGDGGPEALPQRSMQDKATRYYFKETIALGRGSSYVSPMDLNVERGRIEQPIRPTVRFATPIFAVTGEKRGILVLNYHARDLLADLRRKALGRGGEVWLIDGRGYWLLGPDPAVEWAFMYPGRENLSFATAHPDAWAAMLASGGSASAISTATGRFAFASIDRSIGAGSKALSVRPPWYAVAFLSPPRHFVERGGWSFDLAAIWLGTLVLAAIAAVAIGYHWHRRVEADAMVRGLAGKLEADNLSLAAVNRELEAFSYSVSHDLRTPLRSIDGFSLALVEDYAETLDPEGRRYLERIRVAAQRMGQLIDDLLGLARLTQSQLRLESVDVTRLVEGVIEALEVPHPVAWHVEPDMSVEGDARLLQIVFENLLGNAVKFTAGTPEARISVACRMEEKDQVFLVADNGAGFAMEHAGRLFGAFQRLHSSEYPGTGIGLAIVQRIVNRHGGRIWAEASPAVGATFFFTLGKPDK